MESGWHSLIKRSVLKESEFKAQRDSWSFNVYKG